MTGSKTSHIRVTQRIGEGETIRIYAVAGGTLGEAQLWLSQQTLPNGRDLQIWLENKGCLLDSSNGPAFVLRSAFGATLEMYYRAGTLYRKDGPAVVWADGLTAEELYAQRPARPRGRSGAHRTQRQRRNRPWSVRRTGPFDPRRAAASAVLGSQGRQRRQARILEAVGLSKSTGLHGILLLFCIELKKGELLSWGRDRVEVGTKHQLRATLLEKERSHGKVWNDPEWTRTAGTGSGSLGARSIGAGFDGDISLHSTRNV